MRRLFFALWNEGIYYGRLFVLIFSIVATFDFIVAVATVAVGGWGPVLIPLFALVLGFAPLLVFWWDPVVVTAAVVMPQLGTPGGVLNTVTTTPRQAYGGFASMTGIAMLGLNLIWFFGAGEAGRGPASATVAFCGCSWALAYLLLGHTSLRRGPLTAILGVLVALSLIVLAYQVEKRDTKCAIYAKAKLAELEETTKPPREKRWFMKNGNDAPFSVNPSFETYPITGRVSWSCPTADGLGDTTCSTAWDKAADEDDLTRQYTQWGPHDPETIDLNETSRERISWTTKRGRQVILYCR